MAVMPIPPGLPLDGVPIGTIVPYVGPKASLPPQWVECDGRVITNPNSPIAGQRTPRLTDNRFFMSVFDEAQVLDTGGMNDIPNDALHTHSFAGMTDPDAAPVMVKSKEQDNTAVCSSPHTHTFSGTVAGAGQHNHGGENRPRYVSVLYIIRVA